MKYILVVFMLALTGCGFGASVESRVTGYSIKCIDNVNYIMFPTGAVVQYNVDGNVVTCP